MKIEITKDFRFDLESQIRYISKNKPLAARKFKVDLIKKIKKDLKNPLYVILIVLFVISILFILVGYRDFSYRIA